MQVAASTMEAQAQAQANTPPPDSVDSSWDEPLTPSTDGKVRLMCSYGGHIVPRPHDKSLCYVGGDTRIVVVPRHTSLADLSTRLSKSFLHARPFLLKYQLPCEDLDSLVSVTTDEDLENMIDEYDHQNTGNSSKPWRIRLFLFPGGGLGSEEWLSDGALSESASVNCLDDVKHSKDSCSSFGSADDQRSDHGVPLAVGCRKPPTPPPHSQLRSSALVDFPSPDSLSSDSSLSNALPCSKPAIYQDHVQIQSGNSQVPSNTLADPKLNVIDSHGQMQMQQHVQEPGYVLQPQFGQQQQHQPQQYIHGTHITHHTLAGIPAAYYPVYQQPFHPQHHQFDKNYPVYYVQTRHAQPYNLSVQPANVAESAATFPSTQSQNQPNSAAYNPMTNPKSEMISGAYRMEPATPQLVQVPHSQHQPQYVAYSQIHQHHPQAVPPNSAVPANYAYNYADPAHTQVFYTQPLAPSMPLQYQTMAAAAITLPEVSAQLPPDSMKQQVRTSQPL